MAAHKLDMELQLMPHMVSAFLEFVWGMDMKLELELRELKVKLLRRITTNRMMNLKNYGTTKHLRLVEVKFSGGTGGASGVSLLSSDVKSFKNSFFSVCRAKQKSETLF